MSTALQQKPNPKEWHLSGRVLVVDDDEVLAKWIVRKLKSAGLEAESVSSVDAAIKELANKTYHGVVLDIYLGDTKGGMTLVEHVKNLDIPSIAITAKADLEIAKTCLNSGVFRFLEKPFEMDSLLGALSNAWENPRGLSTLVERYLEANGLTENEKKIARLCLKGLSNREIAEINGNTEKTVKFHMTIIYDKCNVGSRTEFFHSIVPT